MGSDGWTDTCFLHTDCASGVDLVGKYQVEVYGMASKTFAACHADSAGFIQWST